MLAISQLSTRQTTSHRTLQYFSSEIRKKTSESQTNPRPLPYTITLSHHLLSHYNSNSGNRLYTHQVYFCPPKNNTSMVWMNGERLAKWKDPKNSCEITRLGGFWRLYRWVCSAWHFLYMNKIFTCCVCLLRGLCWC